MASVSTYLNFNGTTEAAFTFYAEVFGTEIVQPIHRMGPMELPDGGELTPAEQNLIMNIQLPILAGHVLMGTDVLERFGHVLQPGNNVTINLEPDTRAETDRLFAALSADDTDGQPLADMFWGAYFGTCVDRFGTRWMFNCYEPPAS